MENKAIILVMSIAPYDILSEKTNERVSGCTVQYYFIGEHGETLKSMEDLTGGMVGYQRAKISLPLEKREKMCVAPALYEGTFGMKVGSDGKPVMTLNDAEFIAPVDFELMVKSAMEKAEKGKAGESAKR